MTDQLRLFSDEVETLTAYDPLWVDGTPIQKGSQAWGAQIIKKGPPSHWVARPFPSNDDASKRTKAWQAVVNNAAFNFWKGRPLEGRIVGLHLKFYFHRPEVHYGDGMNSRKLTRGAPLDYFKKPDPDKLARCVLDALTGVVYKDDCQVHPLLVERKYCCRFTGGEGVEIRIYA